MKLKLLIKKRKIYEIKTLYTLNKLLLISFMIKIINLFINLYIQKNIFYDN